MSARPLILVVIDGLTPSMLEGTIGSGDTPVLAAIAARGAYGRATSVFPSLTPVCLSAIATGGHGDVHEIPHLVWYDRREQRIVEYGSSFQAVRAAGIGNTLRDTLVNMNAEHLGARAVTVFEALADAGLRTAAVNFTAYRGRTRHRSSVPFLGSVDGPERFFFYNLFSSDRTGAPLSWRNRAAGSVDAYAAAVGRWLVTRDAFDFLLFYLSDYDYASHAAGPDTALEVLRRCDDAIGSLAEAAGGVDELLERYAVVVMSDHGQTHVREAVSIGEALAGLEGVLPLGSNRAAHVYLQPGSRLEPRGVAARLDSLPAAEVALFREGPDAVARRDGEELVFAPAPGGGFSLGGDATILSHPDALRRAWAALGTRTRARCSSRPPTATSSPISAAAITSAAARMAPSAPTTPRFRSSGWVSRATRASIADVAPLVLAHFGVRAPAYALDRAA